MGKKSGNEAKEAGLSEEIRAYIDGEFRSLITLVEAALEKTGSLERSYKAVIELLDTYSDKLLKLAGEVGRLKGKIEKVEALYRKTK